MFGQLYAIDEDAYGLLKNYLDSLRKYFSKTAEGHEVVDDIEGRVCELFNELKNQGVEAINIDHVQKIIKQIGNPEEMDGRPESFEAGTTIENDGETIIGSQPEQTYAESHSNESSGKKKFYRDPKDKMVAGVLSGASKYFGGDLLLWRLGFVVVCLLWNGMNIGHWFFHGSLVISIFPVFAYILVALLAPYARTPEERLRMRGENVNPQNIANELSAEANENEARMRSGRIDGDGMKGCLSGCLSALMIGVLVVAAIIGIGFFITIIVMVCALVAIILSPAGYVATEIFTPDGLALYHDNPVLCWVFVAAALLVVFIPTYCCIHALMSRSGKASHMGTGQRVGWFLGWLAAFVACVFISLHLAVKAADMELFRMGPHSRVEINITDEEPYDDFDSEMADSLEGDSVETDSAMSEEAEEKLDEAMEKMSEALEKILPDDKNISLQMGEDGLKIELSKKTTVNK